jgi:peptide/nickel transport system substrate-binding protein
LLPLFVIVLLSIPVSPTLAEPTHGGTLKLVTQNDLKVLDPFWTTAYISRNHAYMIYDVLFALDEHLTVQPQMVDTWEISQDRLRYTFTLREGLCWHDGPPVTAADVVASLQRWE